MVNTKLFEDKVKKCGKKKSYLAAQIGLSCNGFRNCVVNKAEFKASHIAVLCSELGISALSEKEAIFFAKCES